jgi:hypothetical protein
MQMAMSEDTLDASNAERACERQRGDGANRGGVGEQRISSVRCRTDTLRACEVSKRMFPNSFFP